MNRYRALSVVAPAGVKICEGRKRIEVRQWPPAALPLRDLDELARRPVRADYSVVWDDALPERRRFYTADPFGNRIEFMVDGDGFGQKQINF